MILWQLYATWWYLRVRLAVWRFDREIRRITRDYDDRWVDEIPMDVDDYGR